MRTLMLLACTGPVDSADSSGSDRPIVDSLVGVDLGGGVVVVSASPDPPDVGENTWVVSITGDEVVVSPLMPEHGHGTTPPSFTGEPVDTGLQIGPMPLMMAGLWAFSLSVDGADPVVYQLWLEG